MDMEFMRYLFSSGTSGICAGIGIILLVISCGIAIIGALIRIFGGERTVFYIGGAIMVLGLILIIASCP
jgi:hypothetical protein